MIEFVVIVPVMLVILLGMIDLGRAFVFGVAIQDGAREAARLAERSATDVNVTDAAVMSRLVTASSPALTNCPTSLGSHTGCGGGDWTFSVAITTPNGTSYTSIDAAKADTNFPGSTLTVTARGSVSLLAGVKTSWGMGLFPITVQGMSEMVVL